jgi:hypothetical protein
MNNKFDELAKGMAKSVTRRAALKKFGIGFAGMALACFGLGNTARANKHGGNTCEECMKNCAALGGSKATCKVACAYWCNAQL